MGAHRTLLIDGDVLAYQAASVAERAIEWEPGLFTWHCDFYEVQRSVLAKLEEVRETLSGDATVLALTDSDGNFRKAILPTYKGNRVGVKKPLVLKAVKQWLIDEHGAYWRPGLEGDDVLGILATSNALVKGEKVIVSIDKDMKSIPGLYSRDGKTIVTVTEAEADYWHMYQTLTGDTTDGYSGCRGIGPKKAEAILADGIEWSKIVTVYEKAGFSEEEALVQARVARILRAADYDFKRKEPKLWQPSR